MILNMIRLKNLSIVEPRIFITHKALKLYEPYLSFEPGQSYFIADQGAMSSISQSLIYFTQDSWSDLVFLKTL